MHDASSVSLPVAQSFVDALPSPSQCLDIEMQCAWMQDIFGDACINTRHLVLMGYLGIKNDGSTTLVEDHYALYDDEGEWADPIPDCPSHISQLLKRNLPMRLTLWVVARDPLYILQRQLLGLFWSLRHCHPHRVDAVASLIMQPVIVRGIIVGNDKEAHEKQACIAHFNRQWACYTRTIKNELWDTPYFYRKPVNLEAKAAIAWIPRDTVPTALRQAHDEQDPVKACLCDQAVQPMVDREEKREEDDLSAPLVSLCQKKRYAQHRRLFPKYRVGIFVPVVATHLCDEDRRALSPIAMQRAFSYFYQQYHTRTLGFPAQWAMQRATPHCPPIPQALSGRFGAYCAFQALHAAGECGAIRTESATGMAFIIGPKA